MNILKITLPWWIVPIIIGIGIVAMIIISFYIDRAQRKENDKLLKLKMERMQQYMEARYKPIENIMKDFPTYEALKNRISELSSQEEEKLQNLTTINEKITEKNKLLNEFEAKYIQKNESLQFIQDTKFQIQNDINNLEQAKLLEEAKITELKKLVKTLQQQMEDIKDSYHIATIKAAQDKDEGGWQFNLSASERELVKILNELRENYPSLASDFAAIEWKKIWLPKIQDLCNREDLDGVRGIYRLRLKNNEKVCYVGQAANIKDRWYQHIKKMVGVDSKGNEKLYNSNFTPADFIWEVVERIDNTMIKDINEREHYWIEFFGCKEIGLNKKS